MTTTELPVFPGTRSPRCPFDPPPEYTEWRQGEGIQKVSLRNGTTAWLISRYEDVRAVLSDPRVSADSLRPGMPQLSPSAAAQTPLSTTFVRMDDPEHARLRTMVTRDFTVKRMEALRPRIQELVDGFLDKMIERGQPADLVAEFALPIPSLVISILLGVPYEDHAIFQKNSDIILQHTSTIEQTRAAGAALFGYLLELVKRKEASPGDDIISRLVSERVATGELTHEEVVSMSMLLLFAGHETTANMISLGTVMFLQNPEQLVKVRDSDDPSLIASAVEELLRYLTIVDNAITRVAAEDLTIGGQLIRAGEGIIVSLPTGNRDSSYFELPDTFDVTRNTRGHLAFGYGVHQCLGQALARVELQIALPTLLRRLPGLSLAVPFDQIQFRENTTLFGITALPVRW